MRSLAFLTTFLATAVTAAVVEPVAPPVEPPAPAAESGSAPAPDTTPATATEETIEWIAKLEAGTAVPPAQLAEPQPSEVPGSGITRCAGADGTIIFTDRTCEHHGAVPSASAAPSAGNASTRLFVRSCARTREQLVDGLRDALGAQDANRVASYYHWTGMGNRVAYALMDRLQRFSERPLMDVQLVASAALAASVPSDVPFGWYPMLPPHEPGIPLPERAPDLVRVDQMRGDEDAASEVTYFHLTSNAGCWWIRY